MCLVCLVTGVSALKEENSALKTSLAEEKELVTCLRAQLEKEREKEGIKFWQKEKVRREDRRGSSSQWRGEMKDACMKSLAIGIEGTSVRNVAVNIAHGLGLTPDHVPSLSTLNLWRQVDLRALNREHLVGFLTSSRSLTLCLDDAAYHGHKVRTKFSWKNSPKT